MCDAVELYAEKLENPIRPRDFVAALWRSIDKQKYPATLALMLLSEKTNTSLTQDERKKLYNMMFHQDGLVYEQTSSSNNIAAGLLLRIIRYSTFDSYLKKAQSDGYGLYRLALSRLDNEANKILDSNESYSVSTRRAHVQAAVAYAQKAVELGCQEAMVLLAGFYLNNDVADNNSPTAHAIAAHTLLERAIALGNIEATIKLASLLINGAIQDGRASSQHDLEAYNLLQRLEKRGNLEGLNLLAFLFSQNRVANNKTPLQNLETANELYDRITSVCPTIEVCRAHIDTQRKIIQMQSGLLHSTANSLAGYGIFPRPSATTDESAEARAGAAPQKRPR